MQDLIPFELNPVMKKKTLQAFSFFDACYRSLVLTFSQALCSASVQGTHIFHRRTAKS